jgi:hypothetical protein
MPGYPSKNSRGCCRWSDWPSNNELQRTRGGNAAASPLISVFDGR